MRMSLLALYLVPALIFCQNSEDLYSSPTAQEVSDLVMERTGGASSLIPKNVKIPKFLRKKIKSKFNWLAIKRIEQDSPASFFGMKPFNEYLLFINQTPVQVEDQRASSDFLQLLSKNHQTPIHVVTLRDARGGQHIISYIFPPGKLPFSVQSDAHAVGRIAKGTSIYLYSPQYFEEKGESSFSAGDKASAFSLFKKLVAWYPMSLQAIRVKKIMDDERDKEINEKIQPSLVQLEDYLKKQDMDAAIDLLTNLVSKYPEYKKHNELESKLNQLQNKKKQLAQEALDKRYDELVSIADKFLAKKNWSKAVAQYTKALSLKDEPKVREKLTVAKNEREQARKRYAKKEKAEKLASLISQGSEYMLAEQWVEATSTFKQAQKLSPTPEVEKKLNESIKALADMKEQLLRDIPTLISSGDLDLASSSIESLGTIDPKHQAIPDFNRDLAKKRKAMMKEKEAETVTQLVSNIEILLQELKIEEADTAIRELSKLSPNNSNLEGLRIKLQMMRKKKQSLKEKEKTEKKFRSAKYLADHGKQFKALKKLEEILEEDESNLKAYNLTKKLRSSEQLENAISNYDEAVLFYSPELQFWEVLTNSDISKLEGKTVNLNPSYVFQSLSNGSCLLTLGSESSKLIFWANVTNEKYSDFIFREDSFLKVIGLITGVTYYETARGTRKQALTLDIYYVCGLLNN